MTQPQQLREPLYQMAVINNSGHRARCRMPSAAVVARSASSLKAPFAPVDRQTGLAKQGNCHDFTTSSRVGLGLLEVFQKPLRHQTPFDI